MRWAAQAAWLLGVAADSAEHGQLDISATGTISLPEKFAQVVPETWLVETRVRLVGSREHYETIPFRDGSFDIPNVPPGEYQLVVSHPVLSFDPVHVEVAITDTKQLKVLFLFLVL